MIFENINIPLISVVMPAFNCEKYIAESIQSVMKQTLEDWELIIINDGSGDNTQKIVEQLMIIDQRIKLINNYKNKGVAESRNIAINESRGRYIAFLDSDDIWMENKLEKQLEFMLEKDIAFSYTSYTSIDDKGSEIKTIVCPKFLDYRQALRGNEIGCLTVMIDTTKVENLYMPDVRSEDYAAWLNIMRVGINAYGIQEILSKYRKTNTSLSSNKFKSMCWVWRIYRDCESLNLVQSLYYMMFYIIKGITKHF